MSYRPALPVAGLAGWTFLQRTRARQEEALVQSGMIRRDIEHFRQNIGSVGSAADLVADRRLLSVALGAFGLGEDINNRYFIQKVLEGGTLNPDSLANRLSDKRYLALAKAFGFGDFSTPNTQLSDFPDRIISAFRQQAFERAIGELNPDMRLALGAERELEQILQKETTPDGYWFYVLGTPPLRKVFEVALGLPRSMAGLELGQQLREFRSKAASVFGDGEIAQFAAPDRREALIRRFLALSDTSVAQTGYGPAAAALAILQGGATAGILI